MGKKAKNGKNGESDGMENRPKHDSKSGKLSYLSN